MAGEQHGGRTRERLSKLLRQGGQVLTVEAGANILGTTTNEASTSMARWCKQGWLSRIKRGVYVPVPLESMTRDSALDDAWIIIPDLFAPVYVGGWSAAEYWDLTEQIFRDICVFTSRPVAKRNQIIHNTPFLVTHIPAEHQFGTKTVWKKQIKVMVSDPARTIVDMLSFPWAGGGIGHVIDCFENYLKSPKFTPDLLVSYSELLGNAAVFKRLGFLAEQLLGEDHILVKACRPRLSKGNAQLDPGLKGDKLVTRWRLFIPSILTLGREPKE